MSGFIPTKLSKEEKQAIVNAKLSKEDEKQAIVNAKFGDSRPDVIVYFQCHGSLIINKKMQESSHRLDSYDLFTLDGAVKNILIFMLSGIGTCASGNDLILEDFSRTTPDSGTFATIFKDLDNKYTESHSERNRQYIDFKTPLGTYAVQPLFADGKIGNAFINKYVFIGENDYDIYINDNEGNKIRLSDVHKVGKFLVDKYKKNGKDISYDMAIRLIEIAVSVDVGFVAGYDIAIPGGFYDKKRIINDRIQRISLREVFYLLYLLGYRNPLILDSSCTGNLSLKSDLTERLFQRNAAKMGTSFINVGDLLIEDEANNTNVTDYDIKEFDKKLDDTVEANKYVKETFRLSADSMSLNIIRITGTDTGDINNFITYYNDLGQKLDESDKLDVLDFLFNVAKIAPRDKYGNIVLETYYKIARAANHIKSTVEYPNDTLALTVIDMYRKMETEMETEMNMDVLIALATGAKSLMNGVPGCSERLAILAIIKSLNTENKEMVVKIQEALPSASQLVQVALSVMDNLIELKITEQQAIAGIMQTKNPDGQPDVVKAIPYTQVLADFMNRLFFTEKQAIYCIETTKNRNGSPNFEVAIEYAKTLEYLMNHLNYTEQKAITGINATTHNNKRPDIYAAHEYIRDNIRGGKRIKKTTRRNAQRSKKTTKRNAQLCKKTIKRNAQLCKKTIKRKIK